jgi:phosphoribosylformylglycinamidine synthase
MTIRIEVTNEHAPAAQHVLQGAASLGIKTLRHCQIVRLYFLEEHLAADDIERLCRQLLVDPVVESYRWFELEQEALPAPAHGLKIIEVAPRPGVTDVTARELVNGMSEIGLPLCDVMTATRYELSGELTQEQMRRLARQLLCNETVQHYSFGPIPPQFGHSAAARHEVERVELRQLGDSELLALSKARLLSLDLAEMRAIQEFYRQAGREPSDVELETLAQTWSEHCVHKTFRAHIDYTQLDAQGNVQATQTVDGLFASYIRAATEAIHADWVRSVFVDNAGVIAFDGQYDLAFKVETHNHPSALEPFGGANTGVGGVVRDIIAVSARPIATTDVLCFGPQDWPHERLPAGLLHPRRIAEGVVAGVGDYGNKLGLPTVNGAVIYDEGYLGNPLVFCGCVGLAPLGSHPTRPQIGDLIVAVGGRTGRDGLHGATFSSAELTEATAETTGSAVQIGDPITEKGVLELIEEARRQQLYNAITDCGAGGFSSAVGEMAKELGAMVDLAHAPLKYPDLSPWEIWLSEAQERIVLAVPPEKLEALRGLAVAWSVEVSVLGHFSGDGELRVYADGKLAAQLPMSFLHDGLPRRRLEAVWQPALVEKTATPSLPDPSLTLLALLAQPSVASKEEIVRRYDHEVRGGTLVRPFAGPHMDGPTDAAVLKPLGTWQHNQAFALSVGVNPLLGRCDPYAMAVSAVDEAFRNLAAVGVDPARVALLDNFCWGNPAYPDRLGALVRTCQGCYDAAIAYQAPYISGKDSLYNEFNGKPIPGTLLISAIGIVPDMRRCVTAPFKAAANRLYLLGETRCEMGGSLLYHHLGLAGGVAPAMPADPLRRYRALHCAMLQGYVRSCHDLSEGGLGVALAEMALGGRLGATIALDEMLYAGLSAVEALFSESNGRLLIEVAPGEAAAFEACFEQLPLLRLGEVTNNRRVTVTAEGESLIDLPVEALVKAWKME